MDLLYSRYSSPLEFMNMYINQGRFGEFVENIIAMDNQRKKEVAEKENEDRLFDMYIHSYSMSEMNFEDWKKEVFRNANKGKQAPSTMTKEQQKEQAVKIINDSTMILDGFVLN